MRYLAVFAFFVSLGHVSIAGAQTRSDDGKKVLVVFGDSLSAGYGLAPGQSYPDDLQREFKIGRAHV